MKRAQVENTRRARAAPAGRAADMWPSYYNNKLLNKAIARMRWIDRGTSDMLAKVSRAVFLVSFAVVHGSISLE